MADQVEYKVARPHLGDEVTDTGSTPKFYEEGDMRTADPSVVAGLVKGGVLVDPNAKAEPAAQNKAEGNSPSNKAAPKTAANKAG